MNDQYAQLKDQGLEAWVILIQDDQFQYPNAAYCTKYKKSHGIDMRMLFDPTGATAIYGGKETSIVTNEAATIVYETHADLVTQVTNAIVGELAALPGECSDASVCAEGDMCMPTPAGDAKKCAPICVHGDPASCPEGEVCWRYSAGAPTGACFAAEEIPAE
jgi:hypothetical protein